MRTQTIYPNENGDAECTLRHQFSSIQFQSCLKIIRIMVRKIIFQPQDKQNEIYNANLTVNGSF